ncbi:DUF5610 domain-containing protein [Undibacterium terreum]|uniref:DUF5610 domain-containing protein n=1 Tax=Undibacterium terreum TaxID=1224302 RepID=A0A916XR38_9BURK|nr:DUF5610 domain-containing protein [Undibacterium terreum]GGC98394.1 hypothetical protein GCM10011396_52450 [Undibacterium terreum]
MRVANTTGVQQPISVTPTKAKDVATDTTTSTTTAQDKVTLSSASSSNVKDVTYADPRTSQTAKTGQTDLAAMLAESDRKAQQIIDLIRPLVEQQGLNIAKVASGEQKLTADPATIAAAKDAIAPDGDFGVKKTAERILSFAKASIGDDPSKLDAIRAAVEKGFSEAKAALGGTLPDISQQTYQAIQDTFDSWKANGIPSGDAVVTLPDASSQTSTAASSAHKYSATS